LTFGFTYIGEEIAPVPQCVISYETLSNHSMQPSLLMRHLETKHGDLKHKLLEYFQRKLSDLSASKGQIMSFSGVNIKAVEASYKVSLRIAKAGKPLTIGESLLLPAAKDMASSVSGEKVAKQLESIPLSKDIVSRRTADMASNVKEQFIEKVDASKYFSIQLDESTAASNRAHILRFIRFEVEES
jgi:hypothetical protein